MSPRILIVDDDHSVCEVLASGLAKMGFHVIWRTSAAEALALIRTEEVDVVVADLVMPGMSGLDLCARAEELRAGLPKIVMTAFGDANTESTAIRAGACAVVNKPFPLDALRAALERALRRA